jgi:hypothetical protein
MFQVDIIELLICGLRCYVPYVLCRYEAAHTHYVTLLTNSFELVIYAYLSVASINATDPRDPKRSRGFAVPTDSYRGGNEEFCLLGPQRRLVGQRKSGNVSAVQVAFFWV